MAILLRQLLVILTCIGVVASTPSPANAAVGGLMTIIICADGAPQQITIDARGTPVTADHDCPECCLGALADIAAPAQTHPYLASRGETTTVVVVEAATTQAQTQPHSRAPPSLVT